MKKEKLTYEESVDIILEDIKNLSAKWEQESVKTKAIFDHVIPYFLAELMMVFDNHPPYILTGALSEYIKQACDFVDHQFNCDCKKGD